jgi:hypothetical protein
VIVSITRIVLNFYIKFQVDIQALAHAVELTRQGAVDSMKFAKGDLFQAFQVSIPSISLYILCIVINPHHPFAVKIQCHAKTLVCA